METGIYVRVSTEEQVQEGYSIRAQQEKLKDYARIKDWSIYKIYTDEGISGKNTVDRPAINELIEDVKSGKVENVLVFKIDRLTRSTKDLISLVEIFNENDCAFNSLTESIDTKTASGRMFLKIIGIFAEFERENIAERVQVGFERRAKEGYSTCSFVSSLGYDRVCGEKIQQINNEEANIVKEIFNMFVNENIGVTGIAKRLNLRKVPTKKGKTWNPVVIKAILENVNYIGKVRYAIYDKKRNFEADGLHEPIISEELFNEAQALLARAPQINLTKKPRDENYFCGFLYCVKCGRKLASHTNYRKRADGTKYLKLDYYCPQSGLNACTACSVGHNKVEKAFVEYIENIEDFILDNNNRIIEQEKKLKRLSEQKEEYEIELTRLEKRGKEVMSAYVSGAIDFDNYRSVKELIDKDNKIIICEIENINEKLNQKIHIAKEDIIVELKENWTLLTMKEKRQFLIKFINKIEIVNEKKGKAYITTIKNIEFINGES